MFELFRGENQTSRRTAALTKDRLREASRVVKSYEPSRIPPSIEDAELHFRCSRFGWVDRSQLGQARICTCCFGTEAEPYSADTLPETIKTSGATIPLFFQLSKHLILVSAFLCLYAAIGQYFIVQANCFPQPPAKPIPECGFNLVTIFNFKQRDSLNYSYKIFAEVSMLCILILIFVGFRKFLARSQSIEHEIEKDFRSASQYTVVIYGLREDQRNVQYITGYINALMKANNKEEVSVVKISAASQDCQIGFKQKRIEQLEEEMKQFAGYKDKSQNPKQVDVLLAKIERDQRMIDELKGEIANLQKVDQARPKDDIESTVVFVTMRWKEDVLKVTELDNTVRQLKWDFFMCRKKLNMCVGNYSIHYLKQAPEPQDIIWKNIGVSGMRRTFSVGISYVLAILAILICSYFHFQFYQFRQEIENSDNRRGLVYHLMFNFSGILGGLLIQITNVVVMLIIEYLAHFERPESLSDRTHSLTVKLIILQLINAIYLPFLDNNFKSWKTASNPTNLQSNIFNIELSNCIFTPILSNLKIGALLRLIKRKTKANQIKKGECFDTTQQELNELFEPIKIEIHQLYCMMLRTFFFACFAFHLIPAIMLFCLVFQIIHYYSSKEMIRRFSKRTVTFHSMFNYDMHKISIYSLVVMAFGFWVESTAISGTLFNERIAVALMLLSIFLVYYQSIGYQDTIKKERMNLRKMTKKMSVVSDLDAQIEQGLSVRPDRDLEDVDIGYEEASLHFETDYDRLNPSTAKAATDAWLSRLSVNNAQIVE